MHEAEIKGMRVEWAGQPLNPMKTKQELFLSLVALALAGCASMPPAPDVSDSHPANPKAARSDYPLPQPGLLSITNMVEVKPATEPAAGHEGHDAKPKAEEKK